MRERQRGARLAAGRRVDAVGGDDEQKRALRRERRRLGRGPVEVRHADVAEVVAPRVVRRELEHLGPAVGEHDRLGAAPRTVSPTRPMPTQLEHVAALRHQRPADLVGDDRA